MVIDLTSLIVGLLFGIVIVLLIMFIRKNQQVQPEKEPDTITNLLSLGKWLYQTYRIMKNISNPLAKEKKSEKETEDDSVLKFLLDKKLIVKVENTGEKNYDLSIEGENLCKFLEEASKKSGCNIKT